MVYSHVIQLAAWAGPAIACGWSSFLIQLDYGLEKEWKAETILLAHTVKVVRAVWLQLQTRPVLKTELTIDAQLPVCPRPAKETDNS